MLTETPIRLCILAGICCLPTLRAQSGITVAGFGYRNPANTIVAAPGQMTTVSIFGVAGRFSTPVFPIEVATGFPTAVNGLSASFAQGPVTVQLQIRGVQQTHCPASGACSPATTLTVQIPYELDPGSSDKPSLMILENGTTVATVNINPVVDNVHIINTCDQTGIYLSVAYDVPAGTCVPIVEHTNGQLISPSLPAKGGETLLLWAYGLGALNHPAETACCSTPEQVPVAIQPFSIGFSYFDFGRFPLRRLGQVTPSYVGGGVGIYQVVFTVPSAPSDISPCSNTMGNLKILLSGPTSADSADVCLQ